MGALARSRFFFAAAVAIALGTLVMAVVCRRKAAPLHPSVLVLAVEGLSTRLGSYGDDARTPHVDRLAARGRPFVNAYRTYPDQRVARTSWLTGRRPEASGLFAEPASRAELGPAPTLPELFRSAHYFVGRAGAVFGAADAGITWDAAHDVPAGAEGASAAARAAVALLERRHREQADGRPFFIMASLPKQADGWLPPPEQLARYPVRDVELPAVLDLRSVLPPLALADAGQPAPPLPRPVSEDEQRRALAAQRAAASWLDAQVGTVLEALERLELAESTVVVLIGESTVPPLPGREPPRPDLLREQSLRVPLVIAGPHILRPGVPTEAPVELPDVYTTLAALASLPSPPGVEGSSLKPLLESPRGSADQSALSVVRRKADPIARTVRTDRWRFTHWPDGSRELYDHDSDPGEYNNLAGSPKHAGTVRELRSLLAPERRQPEAAAGLPRHETPVPSQNSSSPFVPPSHAPEPTPPPRPVPPRRPLNVLLIAVDDLNTRLGCYGHDVRTPSVDRLARLGRRFERAYAQYPSCNPSRTSFMTGWRPERTRVWSNLQPPRDQLAGAAPLQEHFRAHGYFTARVGKIYHGPFEDQFKWDVSEHTPYPEPEEPDPEAAPAEARGRRGGMASWWRPTDNADAHEPDGRTARRVAALIQKARGRPFFVAAGFHKPHLRWLAPRRYFDLYPPPRVKLPAEPDEDWADIPEIAIARGAPRWPGAVLPGRLEPEELRRPAVSAYQACVSFMDAQVGVLMQTLDRLALWPTTVVVFVSDHGFHLGEHGGLWRKNTLFEESLRVPLVIVAPGVQQPGRPAPHVVELVDLYPTLVELAGLPAVPKLDGRSLVPLLNDPGQRVKDAAFSMTERVPPELGRSLRTARWRYTVWPDGSEELYDHERDEDERQNLAADSGQARTLRHLRDLLVRRIQ